MGRAENYVENYLVKQAKKHNFFCCKFVSPSTNGVPDRILIGNGHVIFIETKSRTGNLSDIQKEIIKQMQLQKAIVYVANSRQQIDDIIKRISESS